MSPPRYPKLYGLVMLRASLLVTLGLCCLWVIQVLLGLESLEYSLMALTWVKGR